jgi:hypothetical protein
MKPFMLKFRQGTGIHERTIYVNMNQVCHVSPGGYGTAVLTFACVINDEPAYIVVNETPDEIGERPEWKSRP